MSGAGKFARQPWLLGVAALLPLVLAHAPATAAAAAQGPVDFSLSEGFVPPLTPMVLTRMLRKPLGDGNEVIARRSYEVRFVPDGDGFRIDGTLIDVTVDAPAELAAFAALERARPDDSLFPMRVDRNGQFTSSAKAVANAHVREGADLGHAAITRAGLSPGDAAQAHAFVDVVRQRPARTEWPRDLFRPAEGHQIQRSEVPLADGMTGSVMVETEARASHHGGLLSSFARTVTTDLGGDLRQTFETWTLTPRS